MKEKLIYYFKYFLYWIVVMIAFKLLFIVYHVGKFNGVRFIEYILIFVHGFKLDLSLTGYIMIFPTLILLFISWYNNKLATKIISIYTKILVPFISLLFVIDLELYNYWRFRLDDTFLDYINTPKDMLANLAWYQFIILSVALAVIYIVLIEFFYKRLFKKQSPAHKILDWKSSIVFLFMLPVLFISIRGGLSTSPINTGAVYFSKDIMVNHGAINPVWNLIYTLTESEKLKFSVDYFDKQEEMKLVELIKSGESDSPILLNTDKPNIIIVILESFASSVVNELSGREGVTPNLSRLMKEGIFFKNFYATGSSSARGIGAIISNYPSLPNTCILHYENKTEHLPGISKSLKKKGYVNRFFYGGDIDFAHIHSFLINNKFDQIISYKDFSSTDYYSKWGVPDQLVFNRLLETSNQSKQPFLHVYFTLSSHEPFDVPMETVIKGNSRQAMYFNSVYYTDKCLGEFIDKAKNQDWWKNTLVILVADHGSRSENITIFDRKRFNIPMIWLGGALNVKDTVIMRYGSQTDIPATLLHQVNLESGEYIFSKDLFSENSKSYAYYTFSNGIGFVTDTSYLVYDLTGDNFVIEKGATEQSKNILKAQVQYLLEDFRSR